MKYFIYLIIIIFITTGCSFNKVIKKHGVRNLEKKQEKLTILETNKNDIRELLGPPSTKSTFNNDVYIYIENIHYGMLNSNFFIKSKLVSPKIFFNNMLFLLTGELSKSRSEHTYVLKSKGFYSCGVNCTDCVNFQILEYCRTRK